MLSCLPLSHLCYGKAYRSDVRGGNQLQKSVLHSSKTIGFASEISTDLSLGRRPESKSDEFSDANPLGFEIMNILRCNGRFFCFRRAGRAPGLTLAQESGGFGSQKVRGASPAVRSLFGVKMKVL